MPAQFVQVNQSRSVRGVVRGLHFQWDPPQGKLMRVVRGRAFMVAVDVRPGSPTLGRVVTLEASDDDPVLFWAPASFARGFCALADVTEIEYFCTNPYNPACETGVRWNDPALGIDWPVTDAPAVGEGRRRGHARGLARAAGVGGLPLSSVSALTAVRAGAAVVCFPRRATGSRGTISRAERHSHH